MIHGFNALPPSASLDSIWIQRKALGEASTCLSLYGSRKLLTTIPSDSFGKIGMRDSRVAENRGKSTFTATKIRKDKRRMETNKPIIGAFS